MTTVYVVDAEFPFDNRNSLAVFATKASADIYAAMLCNQIYTELSRHDGPALTPADADTWEVNIIDAVSAWEDFPQEDHWGRFDVWMSETEIKS